MPKPRTSTNDSPRPRVGWRTKLSIVALAGTLGLSMSAASGATNPVDVLTLPGATFTSYVPRTVTLLKGRTLFYLNLDAAPHNVVANNGSFSSGLAVGIGKRDKVVGANLLKPGKYGFFCTVHPQMKGTLQVR